ncbi:hypothetical protein BCON_0575g00050 [Botryotinia convoluta]|uniref:Tubulin-specific chaperone A n=1 Tax=Botryotinia convoluta TaxID=54673 RepID=A0A4Z1HGC5_9HELO|nr:hypothetical protein BCON_0575g00050 [Botryotinia convoluta]
MIVISRPSRHFLAKKVDELIRDFELLRPHKRVSSAEYRQAKKNLDGMMERLHAQINEDRETVERLRLRLPELEAAKIRAAENGDHESWNEIDREHQAISIRADRIAAEIHSMGRDIEKISILVIENDIM